MFFIEKNVPQMEEGDCLEGKKYFLLIDKIARNAYRYALDGRWVKLEDGFSLGGFPGGYYQFPFWFRLSWIQRLACE